jgi:predicted aspartyl protease
MKKILLSVTLLMLLAGCKKQTVPDEQSLPIFKSVYSMLQHRDFFNARLRYEADRTKMSEFHQLVAGALIDQAFNRLESSNVKINTVLHTYGARVPDSTRYRLLIAKQINHGKRCEYQQAFSAMDEAINTLAKEIPGKEMKDHQNTRVIWKSLMDQPRQQVIIEAGTTMDMKRDKAGLSNLTVSTGTVSMDFVFDTGANFSTVTATTAKQFNMMMMDSVIDVMAITGATVKARIALCPELHVGNIRVRNAVFLVFADSALAVPQIHYQINGILGFPVIEAMKEIQITRDGKLIVPVQRTECAYRNMALDFLTPVMELNGESYTFDTGANKTVLYEAYFNKYKQSIVKGYTERMVNLGGAGGSLWRKSYQITFSPVIDSKSVSVDSVLVLEENMKDDAKELYGNIGQDLIRKFGKMTLNFESMFIRLD